MGFQWQNDRVNDISYHLEILSLVGKLHCKILVACVEENTIKSLRLISGLDCFQIGDINYN